MKNEKNGGRMPMTSLLKEVFLLHEDNPGFQTEESSCQKLLNMVVMALNLEYVRSPLSVLPFLRRPPSPHHHRAYDRLRWFIKACGATKKVSYLGCGKKRFQFGARSKSLLRP